MHKWNKDAAGIDDPAKIGLKGPPTVVSKVRPAPRAEVVATGRRWPTRRSVNDAALEPLKIFTGPTLEGDLAERARLIPPAPERTPDTPEVTARRDLPAALAATPNCPST